MPMFDATSLAVSLILVKFLENIVLKFPNFRYHGNSGRFDVNLNDTRKLLDPENPCLVQRLWLLY